MNGRTSCLTPGSVCPWPRLSDNSAIDSITMVALGSKPVPVLVATRGAGKVTKEGTLVFNASASYDPDTTPDDQMLTFKWSCQ